MPCRPLPTPSLQQGFLRQTAPISTSDVRSQSTQPASRSVLLGEGPIGPLHGT